MLSNRGLENQTPPDRAWVRQLGLFGAIVSELLAVTLAGGGLGYLARKSLGIGSWIYLVTIPVFFVLGMIRIYRMTRKEIQ